MDTNAEERVQVKVHDADTGEVKVVLMRKELYDHIKTVAQLGRALNLLRRIVQAHHDGVPSHDPEDDRVFMDGGWLLEVETFLDKTDG